MPRYYREISHPDQWADGRQHSDSVNWQLGVLGDLDLRRDHLYVSLWETQPDHHAQLAEIAAALAAARDQSAKSMYFRYVTAAELAAIGKKFHKRIKAQGGERQWTLDATVNSRHREIEPLTVGEAISLAKYMMSGGAADDREEAIHGSEVLKTLSDMIKSGRIAQDMIKNPPREHLKKAGLL